MSEGKGVRGFVTFDFGLYVDGEVLFMGKYFVLVERLLSCDSKLSNSSVDSSDGMCFMGGLL